MWVANFKAIRTSFFFSSPLVFFEGASGVGHGFWLGAHGYDEGFYSASFLCFFWGGSSEKMVFGLGTGSLNSFTRLGPRLAR